MWEVWEHRRLSRRLERLPVEVRKRYQKWKDIVRFSGPPGLRLIRGLRDEGLRGQWRGHRSSRLNEQYRVIYRVVTQQLRVEVIDVTPHDYRKR